jgi:hypothetical protein
MAGMEYRALSICLYVLSLVFAVAALVPVPPSNGNHPYAIGVFVGKAVMVALAVAIFQISRRLGKKASVNSKPR